MSRLPSALLLALLAPAAEAQPLVKKAHTYKTVGDLKIQADVYRPDDAKVRPVVVWIHGGALITGNRAGVPKNLLDLCRDEGYALVYLAGEAPAGSEVNEDGVALGLSAGDSRGGPWLPDPSIRDQN